MPKNPAYIPPYTVPSDMIRTIAEIAEILGRYSVLAESHLTPKLRRANRIRTIQASLAIENNTLSLAQMTSLLDGKRIAGSPREILEVKNAFAAYAAVSQPHTRANG